VHFEVVVVIEVFVDRHRIALERLAAILVLVEQRIGFGNIDISVFVDMF